MGAEEAERLLAMPMFAVHGTLTVAMTEPQSLPKVDWQLVVGTPVASADLNSTRIALTRAPGVVEYFAKGAWADYAPILLQDKLIESFEASNAILSVGRDAVGEHRVEVRETRDAAHRGVAARAGREFETRIGVQCGNVLIARDLADA